MDPTLSATAPSFAGARPALEDAAAAAAAAAGATTDVPAGTEPGPSDPSNIPTTSLQSPAESSKNSQNSQNSRNFQSPELPSSPSPGPGLGDEPEGLHSSKLRAYNTQSFEEEKAAILATASFLASPVATDDKFELLEDFIEQFEFASPELRSDREAVLASVSANGRTLEHCSPQLRSDPEVVLAAMSTFPPAVCWAGPSFFGSKSCVLRAQQQFAGTYRLASKELQGDRDTALPAVKCFGEALQSATDELRADREIVLAAVSNSSRALEFASEELRGDREVVMTALRTQAQEEPPFANILRHASPELRGDREIVLSAIKHVGKAMEFASRELKEDKDFVLLGMREAPVSERSECYFQARASQPKEEMFRHINEYHRAAVSSLACRGEVAHVLAAKLLPDPPDRPKDGHPPPDEPLGITGRPIGRFTCEVSLLSGTNFTCHLPPKISATSSKTRGQDGDSNDASNNISTSSNQHLDQPDHPAKRRKWYSSFGLPTGVDGNFTLEDLAQLLRFELEKHQEGEVQRVAIVFQLGEEDSVAVHAWDWPRPLSDFVCKFA